MLCFFSKLLLRFFNYELVFKGQAPGSSDSQASTCFKGVEDPAANKSANDPQLQDDNSSEKTPLINMEGATNFSLQVKTQFVTLKLKATVTFAN